MPYLLRPLHAAVVASALLSPFAASAGEVYANLGLPGVGLGYAHALNSAFTLRGDFSTLGNHTKNRNEQGVDYQVTAKLNRTGLFADWFVFGGGFRLTGGITSNDFKADLLARGNGQQMTIGNNTFTSATDDRLDVKIRFPRTTPYVGIGYGHQLSQGVGFVFDLGASIGKATVSETHSGTNLGDPTRVSQADIDAELAQLRDGVGKIKALPQVSIGLAVRF